MVDVKHRIRLEDNIIGHILVVEFNETDSRLFDEVMELLQKHTTFRTIQLKEETVLSFPGLTIYPNQRKIFCDKQEIFLTAKEYEILYLLVYNRGQTITYEQIYDKIWGETSLKNCNRSIKYHIYNLRKKLSDVSSDETFTIRCVRQVGYCFELKSAKST